VAVLGTFALVFNGFSTRAMVGDTTNFAGILVVHVTSIPVSSVSSICLECDLIYLEESLMQQQASAIRATFDIGNITDEQSDRMTYEDLS
jgi:hypothetical protein